MKEERGASLRKRQMEQGSAVVEAEGTASAKVMGSISRYKMSIKRGQAQLDT